MSRRRIAVITSSRADYGLYRPLLSLLADSAAAEALVLVTGSHLLPSHGMTVDEITRDGFAVAARVPCLEDDDSPAAVAAAMGRATAGFGRVLDGLAPDLVVALGDRFEMLASALAAVPMNLPIAHIHGGEITEGALDDAFRHALTKISHLHFPAAEPYARRLRQMGEEPWRITVSGAPGLDTLLATPPLDGDAFAALTGLPGDTAPILVTLHPSPRESGAPTAQVDALLPALAGCGRPLLFTRPNADPGGRAIAAAIERFVAGRDDAVLVASLGIAGYRTALGRAAAMVGNSSSGVIEAPSFALPAVNIGRRQDGRLRAGNLVDVPEATPAALAAALDRALDSGFRAGLAGLPNPYGDGRAAPRIAERLTTVPLDRTLVYKRFADL